MHAIAVFHSNSVAYIFTKRILDLFVDMDKLVVATMRTLQSSHRE